MSPLLQALLDTVPPPNSREIQNLDEEIKTQEEIIREEISFEFLNRYTDLCNYRGRLENNIYFEQGFRTCAQLFAEILSKYSS